MDRPAVYVAIDTERQYQDSKWSGADDINNPGDFILYLERIVNRARESYVSPAHDCAACMTEVRKAAAVAVAAMEKFGTGAPRP